MSSAQSGTAAALAGMSQAVVRDAPYSADAVTNVAQVLGDGTKVQRSVTAKVYRDSAGRTRREETVIGLASLTLAADGFQTITISDSVAGIVYVLNPRDRTATQVPLPQLMAIRLPRAPGSGGVTRGGAGVGGQNGRASAGTGGQPSVRVESLGTRDVNGLAVTGRRATQSIPVGAIGNDKPIVITTDTWESSKLRVIVSSRHSDPRTGIVDYQLVNIQLTEPSADLFVLPAGYTIVTSSSVP
jgi:hypothetical protein